MGTNYKGGFKRATMNGKSPFHTIQKIANNNNCTPNQVCSTLVRDHTCFSKPFNGHKFCIPCDFKKSARKNSKETEFFFWQYAIEFAIQQGWVTPEQVYSWSNEQLFWYITNQFNKFYSTPKNFNPNKKVAGFPSNWFKTATPKKRKATKKKTRKARKTRKATGRAKTRKTTRRRRTTARTTRRRTTAKSTRRYSKPRTRKNVRRSTRKTTRPTARRSYSKGRKTTRPSSRRRTQSPRLRLVGSRRPVTRRRAA